MVECKLSYDDFKKEIQNYYVEQKKSNGMAIYHTFKETRKYFKETFQLQRKIFDQYMNKFHDEDWTKTGLRFYGAITSEFTPDKWLITKNGKKYILWGFSLQIRPELNQHTTVTRSSNNIG